MENFKLPQKIATGNKRHFTTTTKYYANREENDRLIKNKALFELNPDIKTSLHLDNEKSQSPDQLFYLLKKTSKNHWIIATQLNYLCMKRSKYVVKQVTYFQKSSLTDLQRKEAESYINLGAVGSSHPNHNTEEEKSIFEIDRYLKRLVGAMYRAKYVQGVVPNPHAINDTVTKAENLITELNNLSHNIQTLTDNNDKIRTELINRNISLIEDQLTTFMDMPSDISDNVD